MIILKHKKLTICRFEYIGSESGLLHFITTRKGGVSNKPYDSLNLGLNTGDSYRNIARNQGLLSNAFDIPLQHLAASRQIHGNAVACISAPPAGRVSQTMWHTHHGFDGFSTQKTAIPLMIRVADCVPILLYDPRAKAVAVVHAGWRGTLENIAQKAVAHMRLMYGSEASDLRAGIGPSIGPCCFCVDKEIAEQFAGSLSGGPPTLMQYKNERAFIDLQEANRLQLTKAGCSGINIELMRCCTRCTSDLFFSHRGEQGKTGRFALMAMLRA